MSDPVTSALEALGNDPEFQGEAELSDEHADDAQEAGDATESPAREAPLPRTPPRNDQVVVSSDAEIKRLNNALDNDLRQIAKNRVELRKAEARKAAEDAEARAVEEEYRKVRDAFLSAPAEVEVPEIRTGKAVWHNGDHDVAIYVIGHWGFHNGRHYVRIEGSETGIPLDEVEYPESRPAPMPAPAPAPQPEPEPAAPVFTPKTGPAVWFHHGGKEDVVNVIGFTASDGVTRALTDEGLKPVFDELVFFDQMDAGVRKLYEDDVPAKPKKPSLRNRMRTPLSRLF